MKQFDAEFWTAEIKKIIDLEIALRASNKRNTYKIYLITVKFFGART